MPSISQPLSYLVNESFLSGTFASALKKSKSIPVLKNKGSSQKILNYRNICIQSQIAKIFEMAFSIRFANFLDSNKLLISS